MTSLFIRAEADQSTGIGHMMRCMALAQAWKQRGGPVCFITGCENPLILDTMRDQGFTKVSVEAFHRQGRGVEEAARSCRSTFGEDRSWVVLDGYPFGLDDQKGVRGRHQLLLVIDDCAHLPRYEADLLLNHNIQAEALRYEANKECAFLLGPRYALLRKEFLDAGRTAETPPIARRVLVTLGGSDPERVTFKIIEALSCLKALELEVKIVVGPANPWSKEIQEAGSTQGLRWDVVEAAKEMPRLMAWADLAITAGGGTCMELAYMGVPFLVLAQAENQRPVMAGFSGKGIGVALGWHADLEPMGLASQIEALAGDQARRESFSRRGQDLVDGCGAGRVAEVMDPTAIAVERVGEEDCEILWRWANEPQARVASFSSTPIPWEDHRQWFTEKLHSDHCLLYKARNQHGVPLGLARFDLGRGCALISVNMDREFRSLGLGSKLIRIATERAIREKNLVGVDALIKKDNAASQRAFMRAGYEKAGEDRCGGNAAIRMRWGGEASA